MKNLLPLLSEKRVFFAGMKTKNALGKIIEIAAEEKTHEAKAEKFLRMLEEVERIGSST
ncbi:MAG: hypothetical protein ACK4GQ_00680 [Candidatus Hadarchaeales archaeon]